MGLAKIVGFDTEELSNGNFRIKVQYEGVPTADKIVNNGKPPKGVVYRELQRKGYLSETGEVLKNVDFAVYMDKNDNGNNANIIYETGKSMEDFISKIASDMASKIVSQITTPPFQPNPSRYDPNSN